MTGSPKSFGLLQFEGLQRPSGRISVTTSGFTAAVHTAVHAVVHAAVNATVNASIHAAVHAASDGIGLQISEIAPNSDFL